jgi:glycosyltransferase involved in cell wall biosynthesis
MAAYNGERYIREQLDSFARQTRLPDELIVCDDCSSDATLTIVKQFARAAPFPVKIVANGQNLGYINNFSKALALSSGDIVFLSDQDDVWLPGKLTTVESYFAAHPNIHLVAHDIAYCKADLAPIGQTKIERMQGIFDLDVSYVVGMATAIRRKLLQRCLPIPICRKMTHDKWLHCCAHFLGAKAIINDVLALHRRHDANVTSASPLNVDFVTTSKHFRTPHLGVAERMAHMRDDIASRREESSVLLDWLMCNRDEIVMAGYAEKATLDGRINELHYRHAAETLRSQILTGPCKTTVKGITKLYCSGGYDFFRGWKSLMGDIVFRGIFRL